MITWFCIDCFAEVPAGAETCPSCGSLTMAESKGYEDKLMAAIRHRLPDRRVIAVQTLAKRRVERAVPALAKLAAQQVDVYLAAEAVHALGLIGGQAALAAVRDARHHPSVIVRAAADAAMRTDDQ